MTDHYAKRNGRARKLDKTECTLGGLAWFQAIDPLPESRLGQRGMSTRDTITEKLTEALKPQSLRVEDESHSMRGMPAQGPAARAFQVYIVSEAFRGRAESTAPHDQYGAARRARERALHALALHASALGTGLSAVVRHGLARFITGQVERRMTNTRYCCDFGLSLSSS